MRRLLPVLYLLALLAPRSSWAWGLEKFDCTTFTERWQHAQDAVSEIFAATGGAVGGQSVLDIGFDNGSLAMSAIGIGFRILGTYEAFYGSPTAALNSILIPLTCHRIPPM
jgi:hypothetical protein